MRVLLFITTILISSVAFGQDTIEVKISSDVCSCMTRIKDLSKDNFADCFQEGIEKNSPLLLKQYETLDKDTSEEAASISGRELYNRLSVNMIFSCPVYYKIIDSLRYTSLSNISKDSVKNQIVSMGKDDSETRDRDFFTRRGVMNFQIANLDSAIADFENAIKLDPYAFQSMFFKAWVLELKKNYDEAISLYTQLATLTQKNDFKIFVAIAQKKKKGL